MVHQCIQCYPLELRGEFWYLPVMYFLQQEQGRKNAIYAGGKNELWIKGSVAEE